MKLDLDLDQDTKSKIVHAVGQSLGLDVPILCCVKIEYNDDRDKHVPLGSVLVMPLLKLRHIPLWMWRSDKVRKAAREATPANRQVFVCSVSAAAYAQAAKGIG